MPLSNKPNGHSRASGRPHLTASTENQLDAANWHFKHWCPEPEVRAQQAATSEHGAASGPSIPKFVSERAARVDELRNRTTSLASTKSGRRREDVDVTDAHGGAAGGDVLAPAREPGRDL